MSKNLPVVKWNNRASQAFRKAYDHILKESYNNAELVKTGIVEIIDTLPEHPERYPLDKFRKKNPEIIELLKLTPTGLLTGILRKKSEYYEFVMSNRNPKNIS